MKIDINEVFHPNMEKILENEKRNTEKEILLKRSNKDNFYNKTYQKGYAIFEKLSKLYYIYIILLYYLCLFIVII